MSDYRALFKHSRNYLFANIATKALAFISIPVYTRLLTVEEYGIVNVLMSVLNIAPILLTLNLEVAIGRYFFDTDDINDFKRFVGCSIRLAGLSFLVMSLIFIILLPWFSSLLSFPFLLTLSILPLSLYRIINSVFQQIYNPLLESKKIAIVSSVQTYLAFGLSVIAILCLNDQKYYGFAIGNIVALFLLGIYMFKQIRPYTIGCWDKKYIKYTINYCIPYIPYSLSGVIIDQFGRIFISADSGFDSAGLYSMAANIAMIMAIFIGLVHQAWNPFYFRYLNNNDYKSLDDDYDIIWRITLLLAVGIAIFGKEIGFVLGGKQYLDSLYVIPVLCVGYAMYQWAYVYMRNTGYAKKTIWNGIVITISGFVNVLLSALLTPIMKELGVAIAFMISYTILMVLSYYVNKLELHVYSPAFKSFFMQFLLCVPFLVLGYCSYEIDMSYQIFIAKVLLLALYSLIIAYKYRDKLLSILK